MPSCLCVCLSAGKKKILKNGSSRVAKATSYQDFITTRVHDDVIVIVAEEEECILPVVKVEPFMCTINIAYLVVLQLSFQQNLERKLSFPCALA